MSLLIDDSDDIFSPNGSPFVIINTALPLVPEDCSELLPIVYNASDDDFVVSDAVNNAYADLDHQTIAPQEDSELRVAELLETVITLYPQQDDDDLAEEENNDYYDDQQTTCALPLFDLSIDYAAFNQCFPPETPLTAQNNDATDNYALSPVFPEQIYVDHCNDDDDCALSGSAEHDQSVYAPVNVSIIADDPDPALATERLRTITLVISDRSKAVFIDEPSVSLRNRRRSQIEVVPPPLVTPPPMLPPLSLIDRVALSINGYHTAVKTFQNKFPRITVSQTPIAANLKQAINGLKFNHYYIRKALKTTHASRHAMNKRHAPKWFQEFVDAALDLYNHTYQMLTAILTVLNSRPKHSDDDADDDEYNNEVDEAFLTFKEDVPVLFAQHIHPHLKLRSLRLVGRCMTQGFENVDRLCNRNYVVSCTCQCNKRCAQNIGFTCMCQFVRKPCNSACSRVQLRKK